MQVSVIIVNYNVQYFLEQCLYALTRAVKNIDAEIIVVDNCSTDNSLKWLPQKFPGVKFIASPENLGFAKANNLGLTYAAGEFILFLNPDTLVGENSIQSVIAAMQKDERIGAAGIKMLDGSGNFLKESKRAFPSPLTSLFKLSGLAALFPRSPLFARYYLGHLDDNTSHEVDVLAGAFMMVKRHVLEEVGSFDEQFFMYGEDVDLSYRIQKAGYKNIYHAGEPIIHFKGESTSKSSLNYVRVFYKAMSIFVKKHYGNGKAGLFNLLIQVAIWARALVSAAKRFALKIGCVTAGLLTKVKSPRKTLSGETPDKKTLIVGTPDEFEQLTQMMKKLGIEGRITRRAEISRSSTFSSLVAGFPEFQVSKKNSSRAEIIFCSGHSNYCDFIRLLPSIPSHINIMYHAAGSSSIVESNSANTAGFSFAVEDRELH